jgi:hypothetical protein
VPSFLLLLQQSIAASQSTPVDPDWLLSTTVQASAVLVAIVGGFLVSRLVDLSAKRAEMIERRNHRDRLRLIKQAEYNDLHADRVAESSNWFTDRHQDDLLAARGEGDIESMLDWIPVGSSTEEMRPVAERFTRSMQAAFADIESKFPPGTAPPRTCRDLEKSGIAIPEKARFVYELVANHIAQEIDSRRQKQESGVTVSWNTSVVDINPPPSKFKVPMSSLIVERQDARIDLERQLGAELRAYGSELALIDEEFARFKNPDAMLGAIIVLVYLVLVGIALPTILMSLRPVPDGPLSRIAVVAAFISGLLVLLAYLLFRLRALKPPKQSNENQEQRTPGL